MATGFVSRVCRATKIMSLLPGKILLPVISIFNISEFSFSQLLSRTSIELMNQRICFYTVDVIPDTVYKYEDTGTLATG